MEVVKYEQKYYKQVNDLYENAFPKEERYLMLEKMIQSKNTKMYCLVDNGLVLGIIYLIFYNDMIFILYLAINIMVRSKGFGSYLLKWCLQKYNDKK